MPEEVHLLDFCAPRVWSCLWVSWTFFGVLILVGLLVLTINGAGPILMYTCLTTVITTDFTDAAFIRRMLWIRLLE